MPLPVKKTQKHSDAEKFANHPLMTTPITPELIEEQTNNLIKARLSLLLKHGFFGQLALRLKLVPMKNDQERQRIPTAAVDGRNFYFNPAFVHCLDHKERVFLVGHELGHCIYEHFIRQGERDPTLYNIAGDYIINNMLDTELVNKSGLRV